ncbi:MAG: iron-sulfur cluster assembly scaffold protein [Bryobacterales bacterium]|nr:iron-sulfur cluster assembly scaffold protein [Bryobacteraceae bacterium]MDW8353827.1 iron-sulfur cluster assembly scaffold protein [Bryobacterales bacterium]
MRPEPCCALGGRSPRDLFEAALRRPRWTGPSDHIGHGRDPAEKLEVIFYLDVDDGLVVRADYRATTCPTLLAYCELLAHWVAGRRTEEALALRAADLVAAVQGVPAHRQGRAALAVEALHAALNSDGERRSERR